MFASIWNSAHGQQESSAVSLRGGATIDASAAAMAMEPSNATTFDIDEFPLVPLIEQDAVAGGEEDEDVQHRRLGLTDWTPCSASYQCNNGCCSGTYSGGVLKCTPLNGGYRSDICVGGGGGSALGDWTQCSASTQCRNGCCSGRYSGGVLKCTPVGGYRADMCVGGGGGEHHVAMVIEATESAPTQENAAVNTDGVAPQVTTVVAEVVEDPLEVVPHY